MVNDNANESANDSENEDVIDASVVGRVLMVLSAALLFQMGFRFWQILAPGFTPGAVAVGLTYGTALGLLILAVVDVDLESWGHLISVWCALVIVGGAGAVLWWQPGVTIGTDAMLFSRVSVDVLLAGGNPFAADMMVAAEAYEADIMHVTPMVNGEAISSLSYPAGMVLWFLPQAITGVGDASLGATLLLVGGGILLFLVLESPARLALAPIIVMIGSRNLVLASVGGILDGLWVLPLLVAMRYWHLERYAAAAFVFGLTAGTKQTVWPIAAALAIWLWADATDLEEFWGRARTTVGYGLAGFMVLNLPFIVWNPRAWVTSVFVPLSTAAPMIHQGVGPTVLSVMGIYALPKGYYSLLAGLSVVVALGLYALYWDRAKWAAWLLPPVILFFYYRNLNSYYTWFLPVGYFALLCFLDARRQRWVAVDELEWVARRIARWNTRYADAAPEESEVR